MENEDKNSDSELESEMEQSEVEPMYIKLWRRTMKNDEGSDGEAKLKEFQQLHEKQLAEKGVDDLSVEEAYQIVLGYRSGYARGLGKGRDVIHIEGAKGKAQLESEVQRLTQREIEMQAEIDRLAQEVVRKDKEAQKKEDEAREREHKREEEALAREHKFREEMEAKFQNFLSRVQASK